jgi:plastocyanin
MSIRSRLPRRARGLLILTVVVAGFCAATALAATSTVKVEDSYFSAKHVTIHKGGTVTWKWGGALLHNVAVKSGPAKFHSRTQVRGTFSHRFTVKGVYHLYCTLHPYMTMTVVVR